MTETLKKLNDEKIEVTTTREADVVTYEKSDLLREIAECEETIRRDKEYLKQLE